MRSGCLPRAAGRLEPGSAFRGLGFEFPPLPLGVVVVQVPAAERGSSNSLFNIAAGIWVSRPDISAELLMNSRPISEEEAGRILASESPKEEGARVLSSFIR